MKRPSSRMTRRAFGLLLAASPAAVPQAPLSKEEELRAARERRLQTAQTLAKFDLPAATEPAFTFRA